jgi:hypothetical protein
MSPTRRERERKVDSCWRPMADFLSSSKMRMWVLHDMNTSSPRPSDIVVPIMSVRYQSTTWCIMNLKRLLVVFRCKDSFLAFNPLIPKPDRWRVNELIGTDITFCISIPLDFIRQKGYGNGNNFTLGSFSAASSPNDTIAPIHHRHELSQITTVAGLNEK